MLKNTHFRCVYSHAAKIFISNRFKKHLKLFMKNTLNNFEKEHKIQFHTILKL